MDPELKYDEKYEYNCPQFVDFAMPISSLNDDNADEYFDFDHEKGEQMGFMADPNMQMPEEFEEPKSPEHTGKSPVLEQNAECHKESQVSDVTKEVSAQTRDDSTQIRTAQGDALEVSKEEKHTESTPHVIEHTDTGSRADGSSQQHDDRIGHKVVDEVAEEEELLKEQHVKEKDNDGEEAEKIMKESMVENVPEDLHMPEMGEMEEAAHFVETTVEDEGETLAATTEEHMEVDGEKVEQEDLQIEVQRESPESPPKTEPECAALPEDKTEITQSPVSAAPLKSEEPVEDVSEPEPSKPRVLPNLVTSWGNRGEAAEDKQETRPQRNTTRRSTRSLNTSSNRLKGTLAGSSATNKQRRSLRLQNTGCRGSQSPAQKRRRMSDRSCSQSRAQSLDRTSSGTSRKAKPVAAAAPVAPPQVKPFISKLTMPTTPTFMKRNKTKPGTQFKSTEQMEIERIADFRRQLVERKKASQASYRLVQESSSYQAKKAVIATTKPEAFNFETDLRIKEHPMATRQDAKSFERQLRSSKGKVSPAKVPRGPTVPKPFKLTENKKRKLEESSSGTSTHSPYRPMALRVQQFHNKTPQRFHTRRSGDHPHSNTSVQHEPAQKPRLTCPKTPHLESRNRKRPVSVQSAAEKEELELQEIQSYQFKARPVNPRVMSNLNIGLKMTSQKEPTKPVAFNLSSERRMKEREVKKAQEEEREEEGHYEFHARPVNSKMLEGPTGIAPAKVRQITEPKSPAFALKNRVRVKEDSSIEEEKPKSRIIHAKPILHVGVPFKPQVSHRTTEIQPFSFAQRDKETMARKEAKIQEIYHEEEKAREFKAKPILETVNMPEKKVKPPTKVEPFNLAIDEKGAKRAEMWSKKMEEELKEQRAKAVAFKAKPADVIYNEPFIPQKPTKPLTEINAFSLNTDRRAGEREQFEQWKLKKELEEREARQRQERLQEEEEKAEVERMRREEMVHKAQPIKHYKPVHVMPSLRPLTNAYSPNFSDRFTK